MKKPNNKIEILIATRIMDWFWFDNGQPENHNIQHWVDQNDKDMGWYFAPYENIGCAWKVVEKVTQKTDYYHIALTLDGRAFANFTTDHHKCALISVKETNGDPTKAQCLAICRAAWMATQRDTLPF